MTVTIKTRGDTAANWTAANPVLANREMGLETDTKNLKVGDGITNWAGLPYWIGGQLAIAILQDQKTAGTHGGTFNSGAWRVRDLNTIVVDQIGGITLVSNQFTLPAGTYLIEAIAPAYSVDRHTARLYNVTAAAVVVNGLNNYSSGAYTDQAGANVSSVVTLAASKTFEVQHQCELSLATLGFGVEQNSKITVDFERYTEVRIWSI